MLASLFEAAFLGYFAAATKYPSVKISCDIGPIDDMRDDVTLEVVEVNGESAGCGRGCIAVEMNVSEDPLTGLLTNEGFPTRSSFTSYWN